jgi:hypothetical protein
MKWFMRWRKPTKMYTTECSDMVKAYELAILEFDTQIEAAMLRHLKRLKEQRKKKGLKVIKTLA